MNKCNCGREFSTKHGLGYHKRNCGKKRIDKKSGYEYCINLKGEIVYTHRYNLEQKIGSKLESWEVSHHIDENKLNNNPENLQLKTISEHAKHHYKELSDVEKKIFNIIGYTQSSKVCTGSKNKQAKLNEDKVSIIKRSLTEGIHVNDLAPQFKVDEKCIRDIRDGKTWKHVII